MTAATSDFPVVLERLQPLTDRVAKATLSPKNDIDLFTHCLKASFVKTYEFVRFVAEQKPDDAFFFAATLRGITEDFISLRFLSNLPASDRQLVCDYITKRNYAKKLAQQERFFGTFRPHQPVLRGQIQDYDPTKLQAYWQANGWPNLRRDMPPTREMARRSDSGLLEVVYDFVFRLTSSIVHFDPSILLRFGWGEVPNITFSARNLGLYYHAMCTIYGGYLLCLYCEAFEKEINLSEKEKISVGELRKHLLRSGRWPEMVTYEEMNLPVPKPSVWPHILVRSIYDLMLQDGFLAGARAIIDREGGSQ